MSGHPVESAGLFGGSLFGAVDACPRTVQNRSRFASSPIYQQRGNLVQADQ